MCDCVARIEQRISEIYPGYDSVDLVEMTLYPNYQTHNNVALCKNGKKNKTVIVQHRYCPFCGIVMGSDAP